MTETLTLTTKNLTPADINAICAALSVPLPTPDVPLDECLRTKGMTPNDVWAAFQNTTDIRLMIACHAMRTVTRLPADPRLNPKPYAPAPVAKPKTPEEAKRAPAPITPEPITGTRVLSMVGPNPKKKGSASYDRFALYAVGDTEADLLAKGLRSADFRWDTERKYIAWTVQAD